MFMNKKSIVSEERQTREGNIPQVVEHGHTAREERQMLQRIQEAHSHAERYFACLQYGEMLANRGRWDEAGAYLVESAEIALEQQDDLWLALSHEKLGDLSLVEENWFGALHHYRYSLRTGEDRLDHSSRERLEGKISVARNALQSEVIAQDPAYIPLSKEYLSGNMAISFVHSDIFLKQYFARCLECNFCHDWCCSFGADIDVRNVGRIQQRKEEIKEFIRPSEVEWFDGEYPYSEEYAGNRYTRINPQGPRCVFISKDQRGCGLHRYAISKQLDYHGLKPLVCILFPLSFEQGILCLAPELDDNSLICSGSGASAYQSLRPELDYYFGRDCVEELDTIERKVLGGN